jgi:hypothetical protein
MRVGNVVGVDQEVLARSRRNSTVTASAGHQQTEGLIRERSLSLPLVGSLRQGAVHQNHTLSRTLNFYEQVSHCGASSRTTDQALCDGAQCQTDPASARMTRVHCHTVPRNSSSGAGAPASRTSGYNGGCPSADGAQTGDASNRRSWSTLADRRWLPHGESLAASVASRKGGGPLQADIAHERVGMPVDELPRAAAPAVNLGDAQRPVLLRQPTHAPTLPLDEN